jgi:hypothetical protein
MLVDDEALHKAAAEYSLAHLNIKQEELPWPDFETNIAQCFSHMCRQLRHSRGHRCRDPHRHYNKVECHVSHLRTDVCTLDKLTNDAYDCLETTVPSSFTADGISHIKLNSSSVNSATPLTLKEHTPDKSNITAAATPAATFLASSNPGDAGFTNLVNPAQTVAVETVVKHQQ